MFLIEYFDYIFKYQSKRFFKHMIEEILLIILMDNNIMIISTNTKTSIKIFASNNRIIIKESFAVSIYVTEHRLTYDSIPNFTLVNYLEEVGFETKILLISWQQEFTH